MSQPQPIKRSKELAALSREHHDGLLLSWKINSGLKKGVDPARIARYIVFFYVNELCRHFIEEEKYIFPLLPDGNNLRTTAEDQHKALRNMIENIRNQPAPDAESLKKFALLLNDHIRFEERTLFKEIEEKTDEKTLIAAESKLSAPNQSKSDWTDQFWIN